MDQQQQTQEQQAFWTQQMSFPLLISSVLFTLDLVFLSSLVQVNSLAGWKTLSLLLFILAFPCLAVNTLLLFKMRATKTVLPGKERQLLVIQLAGYAASILGVWASIMAVSWWIGLVFLIVTFCLAAFCAKKLQQLEHIRTGNP